MKHWLHSPVHIFDEAGTFMVTSGTHGKSMVFNTSHKLDSLHETILEKSSAAGWLLQALAVFPNHYHFIAISPDDPSGLRKLLKNIHGATSRKVNEIDGTPGRKVWFQFWDNRITQRTSYYARLRYVMENPVRHGVAKDARKYRWCSASWFHGAADTAFRNNVYSQRFEGLQISDDFSPDLPAEKDA